MTLFRSLNLTILTCLLLISSAQAEEVRNYQLATATTLGTFYPVGVAISTLVKTKLQNEQNKNIALAAIPSAGSGENIKLLRENKAQFAILQGLFGYYAWNGKGPLQTDGPQQNLRAITMLWKNVEQFTVRKQDVKTGTIEDLGGLKGMPMAFGEKESGTIESNKILLANLGINIENDYKLTYSGYGPSADALEAGQISGMGTPGGVPTLAVKKLMMKVKDGAQLLSFTDEQAKKADAGMGLWTPFVIKAGTYPGQERDIQTIAQPNFLAVRADIDEDTVYHITKTIYENLPYLNKLHESTKVMELQTALTGLPFPLHPGAARYFKETGVKIPDHLTVK